MLDVVSLIIIIALVLVIIMGFAWIATLVRKVGPNEALLIYGLGTRNLPKVIKGGGTVVIPFLQNGRQLSLELRALDVAPRQALSTRQGLAATVEPIAQITVTGAPEP